MASNPGILTEWPWYPLGRFKYVILAPWAIHSTYSFVTKDSSEKDLAYFLIFPFMLLRALHNQIWISLSRYKTAKGTSRIVDKGLEFEQVDRESKWDDQILFNGLLFYIGYMKIPEAWHLPIWRTDGLVITALIHAGPVELLYYWLHRALHHHFLYSRYHSHHHSSIVTEPITSVIHPFGEHIAYFGLFAIPLLTTIWTKTASIASFGLYIIYIDFMNNMGHCNFEHIPKSLFSFFPPLKFLMYTPSFHSLHHTQFRTNFSLFMPIYDYIYNTTDKSSDSLYENSLTRQEDTPQVVHLAHFTTPDSIFHLQPGFARWASEPYTSKWFSALMWPITLLSMIWSSIHGRAFVAERLSFSSLKLQTWVVPKYRSHYSMKGHKEALNRLIEEAILEADKRGVKVLSLGLLNQGEELNGNGELYVQKNPGLRIKVVDGSSLAVAVVVNSIPNGTTQLLLTPPLSKLAYAIAFALSQRGIQVVTLDKRDHEKLKSKLPTVSEAGLIHSTTYAQKVWLVGDGLNKEEQFKAKEETLFIPISQFPPKHFRKDCLYYTTPAMIIPKAFENMHSCENWLPRRVMSAWRVAGILHALEGWDVNECGLNIFNSQQIWEASLKHGFRPLFSTTP